VPDPDALESWTHLGRQIADKGLTVYVATLPCKPDDWFLDGGTRGGFDDYLRYARRIH